MTGPVKKGRAMDVVQFEFSQIANSILVARVGRWLG